MTSESHGSDLCEQIEEGPWTRVFLLLNVTANSNKLQLQRGKKELLLVQVLPLKKRIKAFNHHHYHHHGYS